jgi:hypothetical protein
LVEKPSKLQPALVGGLILGLGSSIPVLDYGNFCCCLWALVASAIAVRMLIKRSPQLPVSSGDGAAAGLLVGLVASAISLVISVPLRMLLWSNTVGAIRTMADSYSDPAGRIWMNEMVRIMEEHPVMLPFLSWFLLAIGSTAVAVVGGIIGVALFEKRKGQPVAPPPPPPQPPLPWDQNPTGGTDL